MPCTIPQLSEAIPAAEWGEGPRILNLQQDKAKWPGIVGLGLPSSSAGKESTCNAGDPG